MALLETISVAMLTGLYVAGLVGIIDLSVDLTSCVVSIFHDFKYFDSNGRAIADSFQLLGFALKYFRKTLKSPTTTFPGDIERRAELQKMIADQAPRLTRL
jgi:hypothetical protein